jgi:NAD(P)-dependent dehydrogenase (short-subunit alcohol dehydrogenase family)
MAGQVAGKVALVGGASGIGQAVAELMVQEGASVVVGDIDELRGPEVVANIKKVSGREAIFLEKMAVRNEATEPKISFRIGINIGDIIIEDNDIFGDAVDVAARVESANRAGFGYLVLLSIRSQD